MNKRWWTLGLAVALSACSAAVGETVVQRSGELYAIGNDPDQGGSMDEARDAATQYCRRNGGQPVVALATTQRLEGQEQHTEIHFRCGPASSGGAVPAAPPPAAPPAAAAPPPAPPAAGAPPPAGH